MADPGRVCWIVVECTCRILGIATATVLCAVGVETLHKGEFHSLGIYLLVAFVGMLLFEGAYFLDAMLFMCLPCPPDWRVFVLWGKMAGVGGFHKFLYYSIMSLVCFLHPVLVWHAVIPGTMTLPGTMLLATACFNFLLAKKPRAGAPKGLQEGYQEPPAGGADTGKPQSIFSSSSSSSSTSSSSSSSFFHMGKDWGGGGGGGGGGLVCVAEGRVSALGEGEESSAQPGAKEPDA
ncbi:transmembrane protein 72 [Gadus chalcogrammus]|uniref:transmembrane protein 72 n=1 Tax=Gadus chalcogrammus TaxID=1042646 RepID=UPI0024C4A80B|nr:transmembrane protein 72 [Gadus chalcogrammus]